LSDIGGLARIATLGFRGEALASIAAVSVVACRSARRGAERGAEITVRHGQVTGERPAAALPGVTVEVLGLLENTPGRRAFLIRPAREIGQMGRVVASRSLSFAVEQAFLGLSVPGLFPVGVLELRLPPESVDVNVHPTKREVRLRQERAVFGMLQEACVSALRRSSSYSGGGLL